MEQSRELRNLALGWFRDLAAGDDGAIELLSVSDDAVFIGSDPDEFWVGGRQVRAIVKQQFAELISSFGSIKIDIDKLHAYASGDVGWAASESNLTLGGGGGFRLRGTLVFARERGSWMLVHAHFSSGRTNLDDLGLALTTSIDDVAQLVAQERTDVADVVSPEGTLTIVFTDIESSTAINEAVGDDRFVAVLKRHHEVLTSSTRSHGGRVVKCSGDGFMLAFPSARRAVDCAIDVQRRLEGVSSPEVPVLVRMGLHAGEPIRFSDDFYGRDVAYAARVGAAAVGGEILVSHVVKELCAGASLTFGAPQAHTFKGFEGPQQVFAVEWRP